MSHLNIAPPKVLIEVVNRNASGEICPKLAPGYAPDRTQLITGLENRRSTTDDPVRCLTKSDHSRCRCYSMLLKETLFFLE